MTGKTQSNAKGNALCQAIHSWDSMFRVLQNVLQSILKNNVLSNHRQAKRKHKFTDLKVSDSRKLATVSRNVNMQLI